MSRVAVWRWLPFILWIALIFYLSSLSRPPQPPEEVGGIAFPWDVIGHFVEYGVLSVLAYRVWRGRYSPGWAYTIALVFCIAYGILDEVHQSYVPQRDASAVDVMVDSQGAAAFLAVVRLWGLRKGPRAVPHSRE